MQLHQYRARFLNVERALLSFQELILHIDLPEGKTMNKTNVEFTDIVCFLLFCGETFEGFEEARRLIFFSTLMRLLFLKSVFQMTYNFPPEAFSSDK